MGKIYKYVCRGCGHKYGSTVGIGMLYPLVQKDMLQEIREGKYGQEWKELSLRPDFSEVDAVNTVYICPDCGNWVNEQAGDLLFLGGTVKRRVRTCSCGQEMERGYGDELSCPECGIRNEFQEEFNWD